MSRMMPLCLICKRYYEAKARPRPEQRDHPSYEYCEAYPDGDGIPLSVYMLGHITPKKGDSGLQFVPKDGIADNVVALYKSIYEEIEDEEYIPLPEDARA